MERIITIKSENYGDYKVELIGIIDFSRVFSKSPSKWIEKFHYVSFFTNVTTRTIKQGDFEFQDIVAVYVPSEEINKEWDYKFWHDLYSNHKKLPKKLPIAIKQSKIIKWQKESKEYLINGCN